MEKHFSKDIVPKKFGLKQAVFLSALFVFGIVDDVRNAVASIPNVIVPSRKMYEFQAKDGIGHWRSMMRRYVVGLIYDSERIIAEHGDSGFQAPESPDFSKMGKKELLQQMQSFYPDFDMNLSDQELKDCINNLLDWEYKKFLNLIQDTYFVNYDLSNLSTIEIVAMADAFINGKSNKLLDFFWQSLQDNLKLATDSPRGYGLCYLEAEMSMSDARRLAYEIIKRIKIMSEFLKGLYQ